MLSRLSNTHCLSLAGLISLTLVALKTAIILLFPEQLYFFGTSIPADYANNAYLQDQNQRFCFFLLSIYAFFASYCVVAETKNISLPFMISVLLLFVLLSILSAVLTLSTPLAEPISASYRYWPIWVINSLTELIIAVLAVAGLKHSWRRLAAKINYQQNIIMLSAVVIGFSIHIFYVPDSYMDWSLGLIKQHKDLLTLLPYELDTLASMFWFNLPKYFALFIFAFVIIRKFGHKRHFVYTLFLSFTFMQFVLKELPIISILTISSESKINQILLLTNIIAIGLFMVFIQLLPKPAKPTS